MKKLTNILTIIFFLLSFNSIAQDNDIIANVRYGCNSLDVQFSLEQTLGVTSVEWTFGNGSSFSGLVPPMVTYSVGVYTVSAVVNGSNQITKTEFIGVFPTPTSQFSFNDTILYGSYNVEFTVEEQAAPFDTVQYFYNWDFDDGVTFTATQRQHGHRYPGPGEYVVDLTVNDSYGCESSSSDTVVIGDRFSIPNVFTPNDDNVNDEFIVETNGRTIYKMTIFTRTGAVVYKTEGAVLMWDGRNNSGVKMSPGIYYYLIDEINGSGRQETGFFYMLYTE